jgi:hypothetical protein
MAIHTIKVTLAADNTAQSIAPAGTAKAKNVLMARIYPEDANTVGANGPARYGDSTVDWTAGAIGVLLLPGIVTELPPGGGGAAVHDLTQTYISGKLGDVFNVIWWNL